MNVPKTKIGQQGGQANHAYSGYNVLASRDCKNYDIEHKLRVNANMLFDKNDSQVSFSASQIAQLTAIINNHSLLNCLPVLLPWDRYQLLRSADPYDRQFARMCDMTSHNLFNIRSNGIVTASPSGKRIRMDPHTEMWAFLLANGLGPVIAHPVGQNKAPDFGEHGTATSADHADEAGVYNSLGDKAIALAIRNTWPECPFHQGSEAADKACAADCSESDASWKDVLGCMHQGLFRAPGGKISRAKTAPSLPLHCQDGCSFPTAAAAAYNLAKDGLRAFSHTEIEKHGSTRAASRFWRNPVHEVQFLSVLGSKVDMLEYRAIVKASVMQLAVELHREGVQDVAGYVLDVQDIFGKFFSSQHWQHPNAARRLISDRNASVAATLHGGRVFDSEDMHAAVEGRKLFCPSFCADDPDYLRARRDIKGTTWALSIPHKTFDHVWPAAVVRFCGPGANAVRSVARAASSLGSPSTPGNAPEAFQPFATSSRSLRSPSTGLRVPSLRVPYAASPLGIAAMTNPGAAARSPSSDESPLGNRSARRWPAGQRRRRSNQIPSSPSPEDESSVDGHGVQGYGGEGMGHTEDDEMLGDEEDDEMIGVSNPPNGPGSDVDMDSGSDISEGINRLLAIKAQREALDEEERQIAVASEKRANKRRVVSGVGRSGSGSSAVGRGVPDTAGAIEAKDVEIAKLRQQLKAAEAAAEQSKRRGNRPRTGKKNAGRPGSRKGGR